MIYSLLLTNYALDQFGRLPAEDYLHVRDAITALAKEPKPYGCLYLVGRDGWHLRVGNIRVVYKIDDERQSITIIHIGRIRDTYD
ncbi:MAG: type II toxin-antitoxin system RelE/ParE family toxin [Acidobacteria bacterium]|nr:type II toxin-antitoxin system RelE/ParE family toxin [Acidobacteriota bacterium]MBI3423789.1 type II toxin-antitoxin system RelE/ParE family toxin [Acidobacteriota bacterium]